MRRAAAERGRVSHILVCEEVLMDPAAVAAQNAERMEQLRAQRGVLAPVATEAIAAVRQLPYAGNVVGWRSSSQRAFLHRVDELEDSLRSLATLLGEAVNSIDRDLVILAAMNG